jgi:transcriptional regulator with XRE-family HTH domain
MIARGSGAVDLKRWHVRKDPCDEASMTKAEILIGARVKEYRQAHEYTLDVLGQKTGLSRSYLSKLENGKVSPSIPTLLKIAQALNTTIGSFLDGLTGPDDDEPVVIRAAQRPVQVRGASTFGYSYERLANGKDSALDAFIVRFTRGRRPPKPFVHAGFEFNYVLSGQVELVYRNRRIVLDPGDSIYYDSSVPHYGTARGSKETVVLAISITNPI